MRIIAGVMSLTLCGCSFGSYGRPVVVPPPGGGDPRTTPGASVDCDTRRLPVALDWVGAGVSINLAAIMLVGGFLDSVFNYDDDTDEDDGIRKAQVTAGSFAMLSALYASSAIYGGVRRGGCERAHLASAFAKLRGEPLRLEGAIYKPSVQRAKSKPAPPKLRLSRLPQLPPVQPAPPPSPASSSPPAPPSPPSPASPPSLASPPAPQP